jgi:predicted CXXCH cytochrome family protein
MSEPEPELSRPLLVLRDAFARARARRAPVARETSDVRRFRGVWLGGTAGAAAVVAVIAFDLGPGGLRSPAPLSRSHQNAGIACGGCHAEPEPSRACRSCHGAHASTRGAHRRLAGEGKLLCTSCHTAHGGESLAFLPSGLAVHRTGGREREVGKVDGFRPATPTTLPLIASARCETCHAARAPGDPLARCLTGPKTQVVCFDEHRSVAAPGPTGGRVAGRPPERDAAAEAARELVASRALVSTGASALRPFAWIVAAALAGVLALVVTRTRRRRPAVPAPAPVALVPAAALARLPVINPTTCLGCYACVDACPYDVLEVERYVARVVRPDDCCGLTLCEQRCPNGSLVVRERDAAVEAPLVDDRLEVKDAAGLYLAGDLTGVPLIKNAINQGALAVRAIAEGLARGRRDPELYDLIIVGAGPAGISAALEAKARGLCFLVLEQGSVAESIRSFPRGKLVFDQPLEMPVVGALWLDESTKEELLGKWLRVVRREKLPIREGTRVTAIERGSEFTLLTTDVGGREATERARRLLLAIGRRGSPRKLGVEIPEAMADRVYYSLADARSFAEKRVLVVGLGDVAMETALALAGQPDARVVVSYRGEGFRRGKSRNIEEVRRAVAAGRLEVIWNSEVRGVEASSVTLAVTGGERRVECDALFVMIGAVPSDELLRHARG